MVTITQIAICISDFKAALILKVVRKRILHILPSCFLCILFLICEAVIYNFKGYGTPFKSHNKYLVSRNHSLEAFVGLVLCCKSQFSFLCFKCFGLTLKWKMGVQGCRRLSLKFGPMCWSSEIPPCSLLQLCLQDVSTTTGQVSSMQ